MFAVPFQCSSSVFLPAPVVSSLYIHTDMVNNSLVTNSDAEYAFLRASKMDEAGAIVLLLSQRGVAVDTCPAIKSVQNPKRGKGGFVLEVYD